jgi:hypothetical protein
MLTVQSTGIDSDNGKCSLVPTAIYMAGVSPLEGRNLNRLSNNGRGINGLVDTSDMGSFPLNMLGKYAAACTCTMMIDAWLRRNRSNAPYIHS